MGTAGLDVEKLAGLLERKKAKCLVIDDDHALDHCVLKIWTKIRPGVVAFIEYENQGVEPRLVGMITRPETFTLNPEKYPLDWEKVLKLSGKRTLDAEIITRWLAKTFIVPYLKNESVDCPCCGNKTIDEAGNYDICLICGWEDDPLQRDDPNYKSGANRISLREARENYLEIGHRDEWVRQMRTPKE